MKLQDADGWIVFELEDGQPLKVDLFEAHETFSAVTRGLTEDSTTPEYYTRLKAAAAAVGLGNVSVRTAAAAAKAIFARVADLEKKEPEPGSVN